MNWRETPRERLLNYRSLLEWKDKEQAPPYIDNDMSQADRDLYLSQHNELYNKLWNEHCAKLPEEVRQSIETKEHPRCQLATKDFSDLKRESLRYLQQLMAHLQSLGRAGLFRVSDSPFGDVRLGVLLEPHARREDFYGSLPEFFMGFEVVYYPPECRPIFQADIQ